MWNCFPSLSNDTSHNWTSFDEFGVHKDFNDRKQSPLYMSNDVVDTELDLFANTIITEHNYCFAKPDNCNASEHGEIIELHPEQLNIDPVETSTSHETDTDLNASVVVGNDTDGGAYCNITHRENEHSRSSSSNHVENDDRRITINEEVLQQPSCSKDVENNNPEPDENQLLGRPKRGRKRKYENQNRETRKRLCIQNKDYFTQRNKFKEAKEFRHYICPCKCSEKVGEENARKEFGKFYSVTSHDAQRALICSMVQESEIKRKRMKTSKKRKYTRLYKMCGKVVCKTFFLQTLMISSCKVNNAMKNIKRPEGVRDCRGIHGGKNKLDDTSVEEVMQHIKKFPKYKSHYRRSDTETEFLSEDTTVEKMYNLYCEEVTKPASLSSYKKIFLSKFNLRRKKLKKDTCKLCDQLEVEMKHCADNIKLQTLKEEKDLHLEKAEKAQTMRKEDMLAARNQPDMETLCFDLQKTLPLPKIPTNIVYYKRQLCVYNLGIHSGKDNKGHCYVWVESEAGRGAQEVGSCLKKHIQENLTTINELVLWSDSCGGQNRNIKIVLILKTILEKHPTLQKITLRYVLPGHSFLPNDSDFGDIECALKLQQRLYTVDDYVNVMKVCRKKNALVVHRMEKEEFFGTQILEKQITNRKVDTENRKINWLQTRELEIRKDKPLSIFMRSDFNQNTAVELRIHRQERKGRPSIGPVQLSQHLILLWPSGKPISQPKLEDLKTLLPLIPKDARPLYRSFYSDDDVQDDIDGFNGHLDFEVEGE